MKEMISYHLRNNIFMHENTQESWHRHMYDWMDFPGHMMGGTGWLGWLLKILFWTFIIGTIILLIIFIMKPDEESSSGQKKTPLEILDERYARGEIEDEEYERRRKKLES